MRLFFGLCALFLFGSCSMTTHKAPKIDGVSLVASRDSITEKHIDPIIEIHANYAAIMPFGFIRSMDEPEIIYNTSRQWFGESKLGAKQSIEALHKRGIKTMLKPHIWMRGEFTGHIKMDTEAHWKRLEASYTAFIIDFAEVAQKTHCDILCIGTELEQFIAHRPQFWRDLIAEIKTVYKGKLTYAANWDEFKRTPFWDALDYIGVDAYFPVSDSQTPTVEDCLKGWRTHKPIIKALSEQFGKPVLFTEFGYRSVDYSGKEPWKADRSMNVVNLQAQVNSTKALFETFWQEDWFAGGFVWKWFHDYEQVGGLENSQFTPQNKPVEAVIKEYYSKD